MTSRSHPARRRTALALLSTVAVLAALTACSSEKERAYALPDKLCGTPVDPATLAPLLPGGDKLSQSVDPGGSDERCRVEVDGKSAMSTGSLWTDLDDTPRKVADWELGVSSADTPEGDDIIHGRTGAVARVDGCPAAKKGDLMYVSMRLVDRKVDEKDTLAFIRSYAKGIRQTERCAGKHQ
jgi:hypothetical protein